MRIQLFSAFSPALALSLIASPLLAGTLSQSAKAAYYPTPSAPYGNNCNAETYEAAQISNQLSNRGRQQQIDAIAQPTEASSHALINSEQELSAFSRERLSALTGERLYTAVRRLLLSNPYAEGSPETGQTRGQATEQAQSNCMALLDSEFLVAQAFDPLPILGPVNSPRDTPPAAVPSATPTPATPAPATQLSPSAAPAPLPAAPAQPDPVLARPAIASPSLSAPASAAPSPAANTDPTNITPSQLNPTPFDGAPITTLSARPDGNYRYVSGSVEARPYSDAELLQQGRTIFVLRKESNRVVGELMPHIGESGICITGIASGDNVVGAAYAAMSTDAESTDTESANTESADTEEKAIAFSSALQLQPTQADAATTSPISAVLDLSSFSMINAGSTFPPKSCDTTTSAE